MISFEEPNTLSKINCSSSYRLPNIVQKINHILKYPEDDFDESIDNILERIIVASTKRLYPDKESQKQFFVQFCDALNWSFKNIHIKKFYNTAPLKSLQEYSHMNLWEKLVNNIYGKEWKLFYRNQIEWGFCHHRTLLLYDIFERLKSRGLEIDYKIFMYPIMEWHSALFLYFQGEKYCADLFGEHHDINIVRKIHQWDTLYDEVKLAKKEWMIAMDKESFIHYIDHRPYKNIRLLFKPDLDDGSSLEIDIAINKDSISIGVWDKSYVSFFKTGLQIPKKLHDGQVIDYLIQNSEWSKNIKQEIAKYLMMVRKKINPKKIRMLINEE